MSHMPQDAGSPKRERQYEHIKGSLKERGTGEEKAEEIAARTVNKERARSGEAKEASRTSLEDISSERRGGDLHMEMEEPIGSGQLDRAQRRQKSGREPGCPLRDGGRDVGKKRPDGAQDEREAGQAQHQGQR